jgi:transposase
MVIQLGELVMILTLHRQGLSVSAIARRVGIDRKPVRNRARSGAPLYGPRQPRARRLEPFEAYLRQRVTAYPGLTPAPSTARDPRARLPQRVG